MQLATYDSIMRRTLSRMGESYDGVAGSGTTGPDAQQWRDVRDALSESLEIWWYKAWWPAICRVERRPLRQEYDSGTTYDLGTEVWHEPSLRYYHAVRDVPTDEQPSEWDGQTWDVNAAYWAESKRLYGGDDYSASTAYVAGDQVFYPETNRWYQCHTATTGDLPTDTDFWGPLVEFIPTLARVLAGFSNIGHVRGMFLHDPRRYPETPTIDYEEVEDGWQVLAEGHPWPWVQYRLRCPRFEGLAFSATETYVPSDDEGEGVVSYVSEVSATTGIPGVAALRAITSHKNRQLFYLLYRATEDDGQGGEYEYRAASTETDTGTDIIKPDNVDSADPGRYHLLVNPS